MHPAFLNDVAAGKAALAHIQREWEGRESVLRLKELDYNWKQMEWWGFFFEWLCFDLLPPAGFVRPGTRYGSTTFDLRRSLNWDLKAHAIKGNSHKAILNDTAATDASIAANGSHGVIVALCDVEYNDTARTFQQWHSELKGGLSKYERERIERTSVSRYRKTHVSLVEIAFVELTAETVADLGIMKQGRNSNGRPRPTKYILDLEDLTDDNSVILRY
jgi:hypothetical protein